MPETSTSKAVPSSIHFHRKWVSSGKRPLSRPSDHYRIRPFDTLHWSRPYCRLLRQLLPPLPHHRSWQTLSLFLSSSSYFFFLQPFLLPLALSPISIKGCCPSVPLFYGGRRIFRLHQLPPDSSIYPPLKFFHQWSPLISTPSCCSLEFLHKLFHRLPSLF